MRVGIGYDVHKLVEDRDLIIGGVKIDYDRGLLGHSDADVLTHALIDAIFGALGPRFQGGGQFKTLGLCQGTYGQEGLQVGKCRLYDYSPGT